MSTGSIVFVHGTGIRLKDYLPAFRNAAKEAKARGITREFVQCAWGDPLGAVFAGDSLPDTKGLDAKDEEDEQQWYYLFEDPLHNLRPLTIPSRDVVEDQSVPGQAPRREIVWNTVKGYTPGPELTVLLERMSLADQWQAAYSFVLDSGVPERAYEAAGADTAEVSYEVARAATAELTLRARAAGLSGPGREVRQRIVERLRIDWGEHVYAITDRVGKVFAKLVTPIVRSKRDVWSDLIAYMIGDILLYQANSAAVHAFIRGKIEQAPEPVYVLAHSLGGIAVFDLLAGENPPKIAGLITFGSQAPLLYEIGALTSLKPPAQPALFPKWLNLFDRDDFLSYVAARLFKGVTDFEIACGRPFPESHSAYLETDEAWEAIREFVK